MKKKRILFLISNLESGGVSKSMINLLSTIDRETYDITLWCGVPKGLFLPLLPDKIRLNVDIRRTYLLDGISGLKGLLSHGYIWLFIGSIIRLGLSFFSKSLAAWWLSKLIPSVNEYYDLIVDYNGQYQLYYMVDKLKSSRKITFFHSDYSQWSFYYNIDRFYYSRVDKIYTISDSCVESLKKFFPNCSSKIEKFENISNLSLIERLSKCEIIEDFSGISFLTIGHVSKNKGTDLAIRAAALLKEKGFSFNWYFIGNIIEDYSGLAKECNVADRIHFMGMKLNPYPYLKKATIYVHPSLFEGKSIALDEAKLLCKPIVVTNFSTVKDQFDDGINASICEMTPKSIAQKIYELCIDKKLMDSYSLYLESHRSSNTSEVNKLYHILECDE